MNDTFFARLARRRAAQLAPGLRAVPRMLPVAAACAALCAASGQADAQSSPAPSATPAAPITSGTEAPPAVISVTQVEQPAFDLPASVDVITGRQLRDGQRGVNLSETLSRVPGLQIQDRQNYAQDLQISSRGFGARSTFGIRGIRLYADGIPATMPDGQGQVSHFSLSSAARVEVLRGPFSALYGNSAGGVISIFSEEGEPGLTLGGSASAGSFNSWRIGAKASGAQGNVNYLVDWGLFATDGYRDHSAARRESENARLKVRLSDATTLTMTVNHLDMPNSQDPLGLTRAQATADPRQADATAYTFNTRKRLVQTQGGFALDHAFNANDSVRLTAYAGERGITQFQAIPVAAQAAATHPGGVIDLGREYQGMDARYIRRGFLNDGAYSITAGFSYDRLDEARRGYQNFIGGITGVQGALRRDEGNRATTFDQYIQGEWQAHPRWRLSAGVRNSRVAVTSTDHYFAAGNGDDSGATVYRATTPVGGVVYSLSNSVNLYATAGRGFETPTLIEIAYRLGGSGLNFGLQPATSKQYEAGVKMNFGRTLVNAAVFSTRTRNEIVVLSNSGGRSIFQNAGRTSREGFELSASTRIGEQVSLYAAYTYVNARYREDFLTCVITTCAVPTVLVPAGSRLPGVPQSSLYAEAQWRAKGKGPSAALEMRMVGSVPVDDRNTDASGGYTVFNARIGWEQKSGGWTLNEFVRVDNLTGKRYIGSVIVNESNGRFFEPSPGRNYLAGISATYKF
jgi:iron complex outermembrane receptor protein